MKELVLNIEKREGGKASLFRAQDKVPAVFYGPKSDSVSIAVSLPEFLKVWKEAGESTVIALHGLGEDKDALIQEVATNPVTERPEHVDFYIIEKGKKLVVSVPIEFAGEAEVEKENGIVVKVLHEIEVEALPKDLPHEIKIDLSVLKTLEDQILIKDIKFPEGVETTLSPDEVVVAVSEAKDEPEPEPEAIDMDSILVEEKGKKEEEETSEGKPKTEEKE
jgi:large subunit ribosomal protein L25